MSTLVCNEEATTIFEVLTANSFGKVRHDRLEGKDHVVVPVVMLIEGVHTGSNGPVFYSREELAKSVPAWNHRPIVVYHPQMNGQLISACDPIVLTNRKVGLTLNAKMQDDKLCAEAWLEESRLKAIDGRILTFLEKNQPTEVSTGLFVFTVQKEGEWKGTKYSIEGIHHRPDHLAILPDKIGACSIADGCGLLANEEDYPLIVDNQISHSAIKNRLQILLQQRFGTTTNLEKMASGNASELGVYVWVTDVFDKFVVYMRQDRLYKLGYSVDLRKNSVELSSESPTEVQRVSDYKPITNEEGDDMSGKKLSEGQRKQMVDNLVSNCKCEANTPWKGKDAAFFSALSDDALQTMEECRVAMEESEKNKVKSPQEFTDSLGNKHTFNSTSNQWETKPKEEEKKESVKMTNNEGQTPAPPPVPAPPPEKKIFTTDEYVQNAPPPIREILQSALKDREEQREMVLQEILTNERNVFTKDFLALKSLEELKGIAALARGNKEPDEVRMFRNDFSPAAGGPRQVGNERAEEPLLVAPLQFGKK